MKIGLSKIRERNPYILFNKWFELASKKEISDPNAISLSTVNSKGQPNVRIVLMKSFNEDGLTFFTNSNSSKGKEIVNLEKDIKKVLNQQVWQLLLEVLPLL